jgi:hypothetical protein
MTIARRQLAISPEKISSTRRGFHCDSDVLRERLDEVGRSFVAGYLCVALHRHAGGRQLGMVPQRDGVSG